MKNTIFICLPTSDIYIYTYIGINCIFCIFYQSVHSTKSSFFINSLNEKNQCILLKDLSIFSTKMHVPICNCSCSCFMLFLYDWSDPEVWLEMRCLTNISVQLSLGKRINLVYWMKTINQLNWQVFCSWAGVFGCH